MAFVGLQTGVLSSRGKVSACGARRSIFVSAGRSVWQAEQRQASSAERKRSAVVRMAASAPAGDPGEEEKTFGQRAALLMYILCWYGANIMFNIVNKKLLKAFPLFTTVTMFQLGMGAVTAVVLWATGISKRHRATNAELRSIYPLAIAHLLGNIFTNLSLRQMAVSFTHTIKAAEPFFSVALAKIFLPGSAFHPAVYASLLPIVAGVTLASANEVSFNWVGFITAMCSNVSFQSRNVLSKKCMADVKMDNLNLFGYISILSCLTVMPFALLLDAPHYAVVTSSALDLGYTSRSLLYTLSLSGFLHFLYNQFSYVVLQRVNPVTHAVGNTMKRVAVIASSIIVFKNEVSPLNKIGTGIAILGVALYSQVKRLKPAKKST